jgi:hypothetical protein
MKIKRLLTAALTLCGLFGLGSAVAKFPPYGSVYDVQYYSDSSYSTRVGGERWTCTGYLNWGVRTIYKVENSWSCPEEQ